MPTSFAEPLLAVDTERMHRIDTRRVENLFSMWSVFHRCADAMDQGRRYENMSWRLWNREALCSQPPAQFAHPPVRRDSTPRQSTRDLPQLSSSVDSASSAEEVASVRDAPRSPVTRADAARPSFVEELSQSTTRPMPPCALEKMVQSIQETKIHQRGGMIGLAPAVAAAVRPIRPAAAARAPPPETPASSAEPPARRTAAAAPRASHSSTSTAPLSSPESALARSNTCGSETSAEFISTPDVVRGFTPSSISHHRTSAHASPRPDPVPIKSSLRHAAPAGGAPPAKFLLGGSSEDEGSSLEEARSFRPPAAAPPPKQASFSDRVETRFVPGTDEDAIASDDDDEDAVDESAIEEDEEDEDEEWEDDSSDAEEPPAAPQFFRIDSSARLATRRSLLTTGLHQSEREHALLGQATSNAAASAAGSRRARPTSPPSGPARAAEAADEPMAMQGIKITRTKPAGGPAHPPALSPRTTRRNMLATELTESLRKHLLWERQQKNTTANAHLQRRHTAHDGMANLQRFPQDSEGASRTNSWNSVFDTGLGEYHSRGW